MQPVSDLDCNHCGGIAFTSRDYRDGVYWFSENDGEKCATCGMPGSVSVSDDYEEDATVTWNDVNENGVYCERPDCEDCNEMRVEDKQTARNLAELSEGKE